MDAKVTVEAIKKAYKVLSDQGITGNLIGTSALWLMGFAVVPNDIDFLVLKAPSGEGLSVELRKGSTEESATAIIDGVKVDYIPGAGLRKRYFNRGVSLIVEGVRVANLAEILGLKRLADRPQDRNFFYRWSYGEIDLRPR